MIGSLHDEQGARPLLPRVWLYTETGGNGDSVQFYDRKPEGQPPTESLFYTRMWIDGQGLTIEGFRRGANLENPARANDDEPAPGDVFELVRYTFRPANLERVK